MKCLFLGILLATSLNSLASESQNTDGYKIVMEYRTVIARYYPNDSYNTASLSEQCKKLKGTLLKSTARVESYNIDAYSGVCMYPKIVNLNNSDPNQQEVSNLEDNKPALYQAVVALRFPSGSIAPEWITDQCESRGGELIDRNSASTNRGFATIVHAGVCKILID